MPGSVANAVSIDVMPWSLCKAFSHSREYPIIENEYRNGESQRGRLANTSLKHWRTSRVLIPSILQGFREFYEDHDGCMIAFYFYDPWDTSPKFSYDALGVSPVGRYVARFECAWSQAAGIGRAEVQLDIVELA